MPEDSKNEAPLLKCGTVIVQPGQPLQFAATDETPNMASGIGKSVGATLRTYIGAARELLDGKYKVQKELAPPHMREPCDVFALRC